MDIRDRILLRANELFMRYGIRSVTMDEIAAQLGISKKTIYLSFKDKDEIVDGVMNNHIEDNEAKFAACRKSSENAMHETFIAVGEMEEMLQVINPLIFYDLEKHHPGAHRKLRDHLYKFIYQMAKENLHRGIAEELYRPDINLDLVAKYRLELSFLCFNQDIFPHNRYKLSEVNRELSLLFMHSIATPKGNKLIEKYTSERNKHLSHESRN